MVRKCWYCVFRVEIMSYGGVLVGLCWYCRCDWWVYYVDGEGEVVWEGCVKCWCSSCRLLVMTCRVYPCVYGCVLFWWC